MKQIQPTIPVTAPMPPDLEQRARIAAAERRISRAELIRLAVIDYLRRLEPIPTPAAQESPNALGKSRP